MDCQDCEVSLLHVTPGFVFFLRCQGLCESVTAALLENRFAPPTKELIQLNRCDLEDPVFLHTFYTMQLFKSGLTHRMHGIGIYYFYFSVFVSGVMSFLVDSSSTGRFNPSSWSNWEYECVFFRMIRLPVWGDSTNANLWHFLKDFPWP